MKKLIYSFRICVNAECVCVSVCVCVCVLRELVNIYLYLNGRVTEDIFSWLSKVEKEDSDAQGKKDQYQKD